MNTELSRNQKSICAIAIILSGIVVSPYLSGKISLAAVFFIELILLALLMFRRGFKLLLSVNEASMWLGIVVMSAQILMYKALNYSSCAWGNSIQQVSFLISFPLSIEFMSALDGNNKRKFFWIVYLCIIINIIDNIRLCTIYPNASDLVVNLEWYPYLKNTNVGGTVFVMFALFFFDISYVIFLNSKNKTIRIVTLFSCIITSYYIVVCGMRATIVILWALSIVLLLITRNNGVDSNKKIFSAIAFILIAIILMIFYVPIMSWLADIMPSERLASRFQSLVAIQSSGIDEESFSGRALLLKESIDTFTGSIKNFLIGIGDHRSSSGYSGYLSSGIGGHSEILDTLARFGIVGFLSICLAYQNYRKIVKNFSFNEPYQQQIATVLGIFVICSLLKSVMYTSMLVIFIMIPLINTILDEECIEESLEV